MSNSKLQEENTTTVTEDSNIESDSERERLDKEAVEEFLKEFVFISFKRPQ
jgi:hypothetical protein